MRINFLTIEEIKLIHFDQIKRYGGMHGLRDERLLDSAINSPKATFNNNFLHTDIFEMACAYIFSIVKNHPFVDGNKRTGLIVSLLFLANNNILIEATDEELFDLTIKIAESKTTEVEIANFFRQKTLHH